MAKTNLPTRLQVGEKRVIIQEQLGKGAFGVVYKVKEEGTSNVLAVPRLRGRLGQVRCRKASWGCFGGRHLLEFFVALCFGRCGQMKNG